MSNVILKNLNGNDDMFLINDNVFSITRLVGKNYWCSIFRWNQNSYLSAAFFTEQFFFN